MYEKDTFKVLKNEFWIVNRINYLNFNCQSDKGTYFYTDVITNNIYHYMHFLLSFLFIPKYMSWKAKSMKQTF